MATLTVMVYLTENVKIDVTTAHVFSECNGTWNLKIYFIKISFRIYLKLFVTILNL